MLEIVAKANALNRTGMVDYNEGGFKDGMGLDSVSEMFVDNFLFWGMGIKQPV